MKSVRLSHRSIAVARLVLAGSLAAWAIAGSGAARAQENAPAWDVYGDTWVATDGLGRALPTFEEVGPPRRDRTVAIFYFLWLGQHSRTGPWDITKILAAHPDAMKNANDPAWGPVSHFHHWGEPLYGYYVSDDPWVIRRHADLLAAAGVDAVICDSTNNNIYGKCVLALCRGLSESRRLGNPAPRYAAIGPFGDANRVVAELYDTLYAPGICADSWFRWDGKPLILADPATLLGRQLNDRHDVSRELAPGHTLGQSFAAAAAFDGVGGCFPTWRETGSAMTLTLFEGGPGGRPVVSGRFRDVQDNGWVYLKTPTPLPAGRYYLEMSQPRGRVGWWAARRPVLNGGEAFADGRPAEGGMTLGLQEPGSRIDEMRRFFTFRKPIASYFTGPSGPDQWGWLEIYPQHIFRNTRGEAEEVTVGVAQNAVGGKLSALSEPGSLGRSYHDGHTDTRPGAVNLGLNFAEQWKRALEVDPRLVFITGWNEWVAQRFAGHKESPDREVYFVDSFNQEGSRDIEPMAGGHGDAYYYQMIGYIRRYKGVRPLAPVAPRPITLDGRGDDWTEVAPEFRDFIGDTGRRNHPGWGKLGPYVNDTGRNDIVAAKVSADARNVYFMARTGAPLTPSTDPDWMLLFIDADRNAATGWLGYDFAVGRGGAKDGRTSLEKNVGGRYEWTPAAPAVAACAVGERMIELAVPRAALGIGALPATLDFKWADGIRQTGDWPDFYLNGDAAPEGRFNYRAQLVRTAATK